MRMRNKTKLHSPLIPIQNFLSAVEPIAKLSRPMSLGQSLPSLFHSMQSKIRLCLVNLASAIILTLLSFATPES